MSGGFIKGFMSGLDDAKACNAAISSAHHHMQRQAYASQMSGRSGVYESQLGVSKRLGCQGCGAPNLALKCEYCGRASQ